MLEVSDLELLGYADSGMMGWPNNDAPGSFWTTPVAEAAARLAELIRHYQPDVVVTYDENGFYGHPDHIQAHRITMAAVELDRASPAKVYWTHRAALGDGGVRPGACGSSAPDWDEPDDGGRTPAEPDDRPARRRDHHLGRHHGVRRAEVRRARRARQPGREHLLPADGPERFTELMGMETFVRVQDRTGAPLPEDDLFAGLR